MNKALLINPSFPSKFNGIPLGLLSIGTELKNKGFEVDFQDFNINNSNIYQVKEIIKNSSADIVFITSTSPTHLLACEYAKIVKETLNIPVIKGGSHERYCYETTLKKHSEIDISCFEEGEKVAIEIMETLNGKKSLESVDGIAFRNDSKVVVNSQRKVIKNLDEFPHLDRSILPFPEKYTFDIFPVKKTTQLRISRGCGFGCNFCVSKGKLRFHTSDYVIKEMQNIVEDGYQSVFWDDSIFTINKNLVSEILNKQKERNIELEMAAQTRSDVNIDQEMIKLLKTSGFSYLSFGLESGDEDVLKKYNKQLNLKSLENAIKISKDHGIRTSVTLIIGSPQETMTSIKKTVDFLNRLSPDYISWSIYSNYPNDKNRFAEEYENGISRDPLFLNFDEGYGSLHEQTYDIIEEKWDYIKRNIKSNKDFAP